MLLRLSDIDKATPYVGRRARFLAQLLKEGFPIPDGFVIPADSYSKYMKEIASEMEILGEENVAQQASRMQMLLQNARYPTEIETETDRQYKEMDLIPNLPKTAARFVMSGKDISNVAVRLSNEAELPFVQGFLNLHGNSEITASIRKLFSMALSRSMLHYKLKKKIPDSLFLENAIVVQKFIPGELFGTVMKHPYDDSKWLVEYCEAKDLFGSLIYGNADPYRFVVDGLSFDIVSDPSSNRSDFAGGKYSTRKIVEYAEKASAIIDQKIMIEFCLFRDRIWILGAKSAKDFPYNVSGIAKKSGSKIEKTDILVLDNCNVDVVPFADRVTGIISRHGSYASRMALVCREMGIPFIITGAEISENEPISIKNGEIISQNRASAVKTAAKDKDKIELSPDVSYLTGEKPVPASLPENILAEPQEEIVLNIKKTATPESEIPLRITKLCVLVQNNSEINKALDFDEILSMSRDIAELPVPVMYIAKEGDITDDLLKTASESKARIVFDVFDRDKMEKFDKKSVGFFVKTPYDMLRTKEIASMANLAILDIANIARLLSNSPDPVLDDVIMKQIGTAVKFFREHDVTCYATNFMLGQEDENVIRELILMGIDGVVVRADNETIADKALQRAERRILLDLARKSLKE